MLKYQSLMIFRKYSNIAIDALGFTRDNRHPYRVLNQVRISLNDGYINCNRDFVLSKPFNPKTSGPQEGLEGIVYKLQLVWFLNVLFGNQAISRTGSKTDV